MKPKNIGFPPTINFVYEGYIQDFLLPKLDELYEKSITLKAKQVLCFTLYAAIILNPEKFLILLEPYYNPPEFKVVKDLLIEYNEIAFATKLSFPVLQSILDPRFYPSPKPEDAALIELFCEGFKTEILQWLKAHYEQDLLYKVLETINAKATA